MLKEVKVAHFTVDSAIMCGRKGFLLFMNQTSISFTGIMLLEPLCALHGRWKSSWSKMQRGVPKWESLLSLVLL